MKLKIESNTLGGLLINLSAVAALLIILSFAFFYKVLPSVTNKDRVVTVPDLIGTSFEEARRTLQTLGLSYEVTDSAFNSEEPPLTVLQQFPRALSKVKIERKIGVKLNAKNPPLVVIPDLTGSTFDFAQKRLKTLDIRVGSVKYRPDIAINSILEMSLNGEKIQPGEKISKGSIIELVIGSSTDKPFPLPDFRGMAYDEVEVYLLGLNLKTGEIHNVPDANFNLNTIQKQRPSVMHFDTVDLWVFNLKRAE